MRIRELEEKDLDQAAALERLCFGPSAWSEKALLDAVNDTNALYLAAVEEPPAERVQTENVETIRLIGYCGIWISLDEGEIMNVAVRESFRGRGCGGCLLRELMARAEERGVRRFLLEVREGNFPAVRLYESLGFKRDGVRKNFYSFPTENALIMTKNISDGT